MEHPQEWDISAAIKDPSKRTEILSTLKSEDGKISKKKGFSQAIDILKRFGEFKYLAELLPAITFFAMHWSLLSLRLIICINLMVVCLRLETQESLNLMALMLLF